MDKLSAQAIEFLVEDGNDQIHGVAKEARDDVDEEQRTEEFVHAV